MLRNPLSRMHCQTITEWQFLRRTFNYSRGFKLLNVYTGANDSISFFFFSSPDNCWSLIFSNSWKNVFLTEDIRKPQGIALLSYNFKCQFDLQDCQGSNHQSHNFLSMRLSPCLCNASAQGDVFTLPILLESESVLVSILLFLIGNIVQFYNS